MIGAMLVLLLVVVGFVFFRDLNRSDPASPVKAIDYQKTMGFAEEAVGFPLLAPPSLPDGWRATSATFVPDPAPTGADLAAPHAVAAWLAAAQIVPTEELEPR